MLSFSDGSTIRVLLPFDPFSLVGVEHLELVRSVDDAPEGTDSADDGEDSLQDLRINFNQSSGGEREMRSSSRRSIANFQR